MKKIVFVIIACLSLNAVVAQQDSLPKRTERTIKFNSRPADHFMIQFSSDHWTGMPDSISSHQSGFSRGFNMYLMTDKPFRSSPKFSIGLGIGIGSSNISFRRMNIDIKSLTTRLPFTAADSSNHFKKYKLSTSFLEVPLEFRFTSRPETPSKSWKIALGGKVGQIINVHTKGKDLQNKNNSSINNYIAKENDKKFFNATRLMATARIGYGIFSLYGSYQINNVLKDAAGAPMKLYQIGFSLSGL